MKKTATWLAALCAVLLALHVVGCDHDPDPVAVEYVSINTPALTLTCGGTARLTATVLPEDADDKTVLWWSSDPSVATVGEDGTVTAVMAGSASITARAGDKTATCVVTVNPIPVTDITLNASALTLTPGTTSKLTATVLPENADGTTVTWSSSDDKVATVDADGTVTTITEGTAVITAQAGGMTVECTVSVKQILIAVEKIALDKDTLMLTRGETGKLTATVTPDNADDTTVLWSSSDPAVATVDNDGTVTTHNAGTTTVTATTQEGGKTATCAVTVNPIRVENVTLNPTTLTLMRDKTGKLTATVTPENADDKTVTWSSSAPAVATVGNDGTVTAVVVGTATVTATTREGGKTAICTVTVSPIPVAAVSLNPTTLTLAPGETGKLTATVTPGNADDKTVTWSSSAPAVATVGDDGTVTAIKAGSATITAQAGGKTATCEVTVKPIVVAVESVTLDKEMLTLTCGETGKLTATVTPGNAEDKTVAWSSSDTDVATVGNDGTVTAGKVGMTYITASAGGRAARCQVTVNVPDVEGFEINSNGLLTKYSGTDAVVVIPNGVTKIGSDAFYGCTSLTSVTIPDGVTSIGSYAFYGCTSLTSVTIPDSVTGIWSHAFEGCNNVYTVTYSGTKELWKAIERQVSLNPTCIICSDGHIGVKDVPPYLTMSGMTVTGHTDGLPTELDIPDGVTSIGDSAFEGCTNLKSVIYKGTEYEWGNVSGSGKSELSDKVTFAK